MKFLKISYFQKKKKTPTRVISIITCSKSAVLIINHVDRNIYLLNKIEIYDLKLIMLEERRERRVN